ncbi:MAG TPA: glycerophosphodiester phosphodiesterase [Iamia sp.]|jgi:glycerophosphoryl diester phosphodiesterase|nr:glycerophosphodiester phosphodiesterase [Iamia sp.]
MTEVIAHRTCPLDAPENSREGVAFAASAGADAVEIDLRLSRDGVPVLSHDPLTFRTTWWPLVVSWTPSAWLTRLRLRDAQETLPAFTDILAVLPDGIELAVDVKDGRSMAAAVETLTDAGMLDRARLWSSHPDAIGVARRVAPGQERAWLQNTETEEAALAYLRRASEVGATAVSVMDVSLTTDVVRAGHDLGLRVNSWVRTLAVQDRVLAAAPDAVVTDWVGEARQRLAAG